MTRHFIAGGTLFMRKKMFNKKRQIGIVIAIICVVIDILTKNAVLAVFPPLNMFPIKVIPDFFNITLAFNRGVSFSMFASLPHDQLPYVLAGISAIASLFFIYFMQKNSTKWAIIGFGLMLGGAVGNMIDRFRFGAVVDFIQVHYENWYFPAFNMADTFISVGVAFILLDAIVEFRLERKNK